MSRIRVNSIVNRNDDGGPTLLKGATIPSGQIFKVESGVTVSGILTASSFVGNGSQLINLSFPPLQKAYALSLVLDSLPYRC